MKKPISFIVFLAISITVLSIIQIVISNRLSTTGVTLGKIQDQIRVYKTDNALISEKLFSYSSLTNIASRAAVLGFTNSTSRLVFTDTLPLVAKQ